MSTTPRVRRLLPILILIVLTLWGLFALAAHVAPKHDADFHQMAQDFNMLSALFEGLAFAAVVAALWLQQGDLDRQKGDMEEQRRDFQQQLRALNDQADLLTLQAFLRYARQEYFKDAQELDDATTVVFALLNERTTQVVNRQAQVLRGRRADQHL